MSPLFMYPRQACIKGGGRGAYVPPDFGRSEGATGSGATIASRPPRFLDFDTCLQGICQNLFMLPEIKLLSHNNVWLLDFFSSF